MSTIEKLSILFPELGQKEQLSTKGGWGSYGGWGGAMTLPGVTIYSNYNNWGPNNNPYDAGNGGGNSDYYGGTDYYDNQNQGGGGNGGYDPYDDHSLDKSKLPVADGTQTQVANFCVFRSMEVVEKFFGKSLTQGDYILKYAQSTGNFNVLTVGFEGTLAQMNSFFSTNFITSECANTTAIKAALDNSHPVLAFLINDVLQNNTIDGHEVVIIGYTDDNKFEFYNPATDQYEFLNADQFNGAIEIQDSKG